MFTVGDKVWVRDDDEFWDGEVVDVSATDAKALVAYETKYYFLHRWMTQEELAANAIAKGEKHG
jgi:hypothetical protein